MIDHLMGRGLTSVTKCCLCNQQEELAHYIFIHYDWVVQSLVFGNLFFLLLV